MHNARGSLLARAGAHIDVITFPTITINRAGARPRQHNKRKPLKGCVYARKKQKQIGALLRALFVSIQQSSDAMVEAPGVRFYEN